MDWTRLVNKAETKHFIANSVWVTHNTDRPPYWRRKKGWIAGQPPLILKGGVVFLKTARGLADRPILTLKKPKAGVITEQEAKDAAIAQVERAYAEYETERTRALSTTPPKPGMVLKLKRALYGLKQAGRTWNRKLDSKLRELGFVQSKNDACLYTHKRPGQDLGDGSVGTGIIRLNVWVDDVFATYNAPRTL